MRIRSSSVLEPTQLLGHRNQLAPKRLPVARRSSHVSHVDHLEASFARLARGLPGRVGIAFAPLGGGSIRPLGPLQVAHAWSTMKVPVLVTLMRHLEGRGRTEERRVGKECRSRWSPY